jgi:hypothetical protein
VGEWGSGGVGEWGSEIPTKSQIYTTDFQV